MKKYILDKNDVLGKNVLIAKGDLANFDNKLNVSLLISKGILLYGKDTLPEETYINLSLITSAALFTEFIFFISDMKKKKVSKENILKLLEVLNSEGYEISNEFMPIYTSYEKGISSMLFSNGVSINYVDGDYKFIDLNEVDKNITNLNCSEEELMEAVSGKDITDSVYKVLLSEKKYKKYKKNKQNK